MKKKLVILSGAGISKESGIDTFRDKDGLWKKHDAMKLASIEGWKDNPQAVLDFYNARRRQLLTVQPNKAHKLLAELEQWYDVSIITQNVDNLHERAGSTHVIHLHGELAKVCSSINKENAACIESRPLSDDIHIGDKARDGSQLRPYIVWFGEAVPNMKEAMNTAFEADIFVVIGTSLQVSPANILTACSGATHNIVIDPGEVEVPDGFLHIKESATVGMEMLFTSLRKQMKDMISYLSKFREETPVWLENYLRGERISFRDIMSSRVGYYPGSGYDGTLMKVGNKSHCVHSFLYVDYLLKRENLEAHIAEKDSILGYHPIGKLEWQESDLMPNGQYPFDINIRPKHGSPDTFVDKDETPYCFSLIMERDEGRDDSWGAEHFVVTFLFADGIDTYYQLFVKEYSKAPWLFLLQDHGWGCNYDSFGKGGILDKIIQKHRCYPEFVLCGDGCTRIWRGYEMVADVSPIYGEMHSYRRELFQVIR